MIITITNCAQLKLTIFKVYNRLRDAAALFEGTKMLLNPLCHHTKMIIEHLLLRDINTIATDMF